jgi:allophanate hydrolase
VLPACRTLDCVSIFALTVPDAAAVLSVIEGPDAHDDYSDHAAGPAALGAGRLGQLRVGVPQSVRVNAADGYDAAWDVACDRIKALGATAVPVDFTVLHEVAQLLYEGPWVAERYAVIESVLREQPQAVDPTVAAVVRKAESQRAVDAFRAQYRLQHLRAQAQALWGQVDVLMVPTAPRHPRFSELAADPIGVNSELGTYTNFVNLLGWSALAVPDGHAADGLPFGVTFIGPRAADAALAGWGAAWHAATGLTLGRSDRSVPAAKGPSTGLSGSSSAAWPQVEPTLPIAVVGAHLSGLPLNGQLLERGCTLAGRTRTAPRYRLHALPGTTPPKPGLQKVRQGGVAIEVEVWNMPLREVGSFLALIPAPLGLGSIELEDGQTVHGFLCEAHALADAPDVSEHGGWRAYLQASRLPQAA